MLYRLIPVTEEIIRCVIAKDESKDRADSLDHREKGVSGSCSLKQRKQTKIAEVKTWQQFWPH
ncbi:MAG: hypothetical protein ACLU6Y_00545 [Ruminococcus sp.]